MGLDLVLGAIVLLAALRGWFRGFTSQAVRLASFIGCFYLADPVREEIRPYIIPRLPLIDPALLDRIFWWVSAVIAYILMLAVLSLAVRLMRTPPEPGEPMPRREDRIGGMFLGVGKGLLAAALLSALVLKFDEDLARHAPWAQRQTTGSFAMKWTRQYQPVPRIWAAPPVRHFVEHIQRNGMGQKAEAEPVKEVAERTSMDAQASGVAPRLDLPVAEAPAD
jgi:Colicin V production protein